MARGDRVELRGFGAFSVKQRPARTGRNPRTGAHVAVDQKCVPFFKTGKEMRERLNRPSDRLSRALAAIRPASRCVRKIVAALILVPLAIVIVAFAVANRQTVTVSLDPFSSEQPAASVTLPLFALIIVLLIVGVVIGGIAAWLRQGKWRRTARRLRTRGRPRCAARLDSLKRAGERRDADSGAGRAARAAAAEAAGPLSTPPLARKTKRARRCRTAADIDRQCTDRAS